MKNKAHGRESTQMTQHDVLVERLDNLKEDTKEIKEHLKELNGSVAGNSRWISRQQGINVVLGALFTVSIAIISWLLKSI